LSAPRPQQQKNNLPQRLIYCSTRTSTGAAKPRGIQAPGLVV
jgi:hypothetical protein